MQIISIIASIVLIIVVFLAIITTGYVKAPPDTAFIITGAGRKKILIGNAGICIPIINRLDRLLLRQVSVDIKTSQQPHPFSLNGWGLQE